MPEVQFDAALLVAAHEKALREAAAEAAAAPAPPPAPFEPPAKEQAYIQIRP